MPQPCETERVDRKVPAAHSPHIGWKARKHKVPYWVRWHSNTYREGLREIDRPCPSVRTSPNRRITLQRNSPETVPISGPSCPENVAVCRGPHPLSRSRRRNRARERSTSAASQPLAPMTKNRQVGCLHLNTRRARFHERTHELTVPNLVPGPAHIQRSVQ